MSLNDPATAPLKASLFELAIQSDDPQRLADFYSRAMGYQFRAVGDALLGSALDRRLAILPGTPKKLGYAAYAVSGQTDLDGLEARLYAAGTAFEWIAMDGFAGDVLAVADPDGNQFRFGLSAIQSTTIAPVGAAALPARLQHVVFATTDVERLLSFFIDTLGFVLSDRVLDGDGGLRTAFVRCSHEHHSLAVFAASENRLDHHCYEAVEWNLIRDWADQFSRQHISLKWGPGRHGPGDNLFLFIHDVDGNWVEISAELEHVDADRPAGVWPHEERTLNSWGIGLLRS